MKRFYLIGFALLMSFDTLSQVSFKLASIHAMPMAPDLAWLMRIFQEPWIYGAIVGYIGAFFTWITLLKRAPIGPAFAASHLEIISVLFLSVVLFNEHLTWIQLVGSVVIICGIIFLSLSETDAASS